jgi:hypothetical protein
MRVLNKLVRKLTIAATAALSFTQPFSAQSQDLNAFSQCVVFLHHDFIQTTTTPQGTFQVGLRKPGTQAFVPNILSKSGSAILLTARNHGYLATAKHVATDMTFTGDDWLVTGSANGMSTNLLLASARGTNSSEWIHHDTADVSILPLTPTPEALSILNGHFLDLPSSTLLGTNLPARSQALTVIGFPLGIGWGRQPDELFAPCTKHTRAASGYLNGRTIFLVEDPSVQGYSGAPVFDLAEGIDTGSAHISGGRPALFGLVSFTASDDTGGKMGGVVPIHFVLDLVEKHLAKQ